jgi:hypothetical protein
MHSYGRVGALRARGEKMTREIDREELTLIDFWGRVPISFRLSLSTAEEALIGPDLGKLAHTIS